VELQVPVVQQRVYGEFLPLPPQQIPDGRTVLQFVTPDGCLHTWPFGPDQARELGRSLLAPSVAVAGAGDMPAAPPPERGAAGA
jgi:hypothetical protein